MRLRRCAPAIAVLAAVLALVACGDDGADLPAGTVAQVGDAAITQGELDRAIAQRRAQAEAQGADFPEEGSEELTELRRQALDSLVLQRVIEFEARKCGEACRVSRDEVTAQLEQITRTDFGGSKEDLTSFLEQSDLTERDARRLLRLDLQYEKLFNHVTRGVRFSEEDARAYYDENPSQFKVPAGRSARHILVRTRAEAEALRGRLTPANFAQLARERSIDEGSKPRGGDLGQIQRGALVPEFEKAAFALRDGAISGPVRTQFGWHLITVDVTPARTISLAEAKDRIIASQLQQRRQERFNAWRDEVVAGWRDRTVYADEGLRPEEEEPAPTGTATAAAGTTTAP
jgi:parvulin-like peptidyl-prolyl isomerase